MTAGDGASRASTSALSMRVGTVEASRTTACAAAPRRAKRASTRSCTPCGTPSAAVAQQLADEQGVAVRRAREGPSAERIAALARRATASGDSGCSASRVTRLDGSSPSSRRSGCAADDLVVAPRQHQQAGHAVDAAAEELEQVQRGVVGPVHVLEDGHDGAAAALQRRQHRLEQIGARDGPAAAARRIRRRCRARCRAAARADAASRASRRRPTTASRRRAAGRTPSAASSCRCRPRRSPAARGRCPAAWPPAGRRRSAGRRRARRGPWRHARQPVDGRHHRVEIGRRDVQAEAVGEHVGEFRARLQLAFDAARRTAAGRPTGAG